MLLAQHLLNNECFSLSKLHNSAYPPLTRICNPFAALTYIEDNKKAFTIAHEGFPGTQQGTNSEPNLQRFNEN
jgi:hypothetical protein